jgi:hypothetical protein
MMAERFRVYEDFRDGKHYACIHRNECTLCEDGRGMNPGAGTDIGRWIPSAIFEPVLSYRAAAEIAAKLGNGVVVLNCERCRPHA